MHCTDHDRWQAHEVIHSLQDIRHRHLMDLSCVDLTVFEQAIDTLRRFAHRVDQIPPHLEDTTPDQAWWMGESCNAEGGSPDGNPFPPHDERHKAYSFGYRGIPTNFGKKAA